MSKLIAEEIVEAVTLGDKEGFMSAFQSALAAKVSDALEIKKVEIASTLIAPASSEVVEEEVEQIDEATKHPAHAEIVDRLKAKYGQGKVTVKKEDGDWTAEHTDKYGESYAHRVTQDKAGKVKIHPSHFSSSYYGEEVELDESRAAERLMDRLDFNSNSYHENNLKHIAIAPTAHLKYLLKFNMGRSGGGEHPMIPHIKKELEKRSMKKEEVERIDEAKYADDPAHKIASGLASKMNAESPYKNNKGDVHKHIVHSTKEGDGVTHFVTQKRDLSGDHNTPYASVTHRDNKIHWEVGNSRMKQDPSGVDSPKEAKSQLHAAIDATHKRIRNMYDMDLSPEEARAANQARVQKSREDNMKKEEVEQVDEATPPIYPVHHIPTGKRVGTFQAGKGFTPHPNSNLKPGEIPNYHAKGKEPINMGSDRKMKVEEVEEIDEGTPEAKGQSRLAWRMDTAGVIAKNHAKIAAKKKAAQKKLLSGKGK